MFWGVIATLLLLVEAVVTSERPAWLLPFARFRLEATRRFRLPPVARGADDATYREPGLRFDEALPRVGAFRAAGVRVAQAGGGGFMAATNNWRADFLLRVDARREGDDVVLTARYAPSPLSVCVAAPALLLSWLGREGAEGLSPIVFICFVVAPVSLFWKARDRATRAAPRALEAIEGEVLRTRSGRGAAPAPGGASWGTRLRVLLPVALLWVFFTQYERADEGTKHLLSARYGLDERDAARLTPFLNESGKVLLGRPAIKAALREKRLSPDDMATALARGLPRLSDADLLELRALHERLASSSADLCAAFDAKSGDQRPLFEALARQDANTVRALLRLNNRAIELAVASLGAVPPDDPDAVIEAGVKAMIEAAPETEREAYVARLLAKDGTGKAHCEAFRAFGEGLRRLPTTEQARLLRARHLAAVLDD